MCMPHWRIREATAADDTAIGDLLVKVFVDAYARKLPEVVVTERRKAELRDVATKRKFARVWVAEVAGQIAGTVSLWPPGAQGSEAWLEGAADLRHFGISQAHRSPELTDALLSEAENAARQAKASAVCLHVRRGAIGVRRLYEARQYRPDPSGDIDALPEVYLEALALRLT